MVMAAALLLVLQNNDMLQIFIMSRHQHFLVAPPSYVQRSTLKGKPMKFFKIVAAAALLATGAVQASAQSALDEILSGGVLKVGTTGDWNPMTMRDIATNSYVGYDIDVMTALANDLGVEIEFVPTDWKTLVAGVTSGQYHITGSASVSPARAKAAGYSDSYFSLMTVPLTLRENADRFTSWDDLNVESVSVAATLGTTQEGQVKQYFPEATHRIVEAPARDFQEVLSGRADASITSNIEAATLVEQYENLIIIPVDAGRSPTPVAMLLPQADQVWINYVNTWIGLKREQGFFDDLGEQWGLNAE
jgi:cyclohexadienyl dehydratase